MTTTFAGESGQLIENAYAYSRISRAGLQEKGAGIKRQDDKAIAICKLHNWKLVPVTLVDLGYSGYTGENLLAGCLRDFIDAAQTGKLLPNPVLIIEQWDRFSRLDVDESEPQVIELLKIGVAIHNGFNHKTYTKSSTRDLASRIEILLGFKQAWEYSSNLSRRVNDAFSRKYALATDGKAVQLGYWQPAWINYVGERKSVGRFETNKIADIVREIAMDYLDGKSMLQIANELNERNVPCIGRGAKKGKQWRQGQVAYLLASESLVGTITIAGHRFDHYYPAIINNSEWDLLVAKRQENQERKGGSRKGQFIANLFRNRVRCSNCGGSVCTQHNDKGHVRYYYKCASSRCNHQKCQVKSMVPVHLIEEDFFGNVLGLDFDRLLSSRTPDSQRRIAKLQAKLAELKSQMAKWTAIGNIAGVDEIVANITTIKTEQNKIEHALQEEHKKQIGSTNGPASLSKIRDLINRWNSVKSSKQPGIAKLASDSVAIDRALITALADGSLRAKLLLELPHLVKTIEVDLENRRYAAHFTTGTSSGWQDIG